MRNSTLLLAAIYEEIDRCKQASPFREAVVYMTDECRKLIIGDILCVLDETRKPPVYDKIFGCVTRRMVADGIRFAVAHENVFERSKENAE